MIPPETRASLVLDPGLTPAERPLAFHIGLLRANGGVHVEVVTPSSIIVVNTMPIPAVTVFVVVEANVPPAALALVQQFVHRLLLSRKGFV